MIEKKDKNIEILTESILDARFLNKEDLYNLLSVNFELWLKENQDDKKSIKEKVSECEAVLIGLKNQKNNFEVRLSLLEKDAERGLVIPKKTLRDVYTSIKKCNTLIDVNNVKLKRLRKFERIAISRSREHYFIQEVKRILQLELGKEKQFEIFRTADYNIK